MMRVGGMYRRRHRQSLLTARAGQMRFCRAGARAGCPLAGTKHECLVLVGLLCGTTGGGMEVGLGRYGGNVAAQQGEMWRWYWPQ